VLDTDQELLDEAGTPVWASFRAKAATITTSLRCREQCRAETRHCSRSRRSWSG